MSGFNSVLCAGTAIVLALKKKNVERNVVVFFLYFRRLKRAIFFCINIVKISHIIFFDLCGHNCFKKKKNTERFETRNADDLYFSYELM